VAAVVITNDDENLAKNPGDVKGTGTDRSDWADA
jgi:hypothetical protein